MQSRIPGWLYLAVIATGLFSIAYAPTRLFASTDPAVIAATVSEQLPLLRTAIVISAACSIAYLLLPLSLFPVLAPAGRQAATIMVALAATSVPVSLVGVAEWLEILALVEGRGPMAAWSKDSLHRAIAIADFRHDALQRVAALFWGLWLIPLGLLAWRAKLLPRVVCALLLLGGVGYVVAISGSWLFPSFGASAWPGRLTRPATIGELSTCAWLLVRPPKATGVRAD